jgi:2-polyprenyl-6-methoxyphenol hydroxylase-like FAD-dependent oxidoreductase
MAKNGAKVLVVERTKQYRDRVRGECMHPWGVLEASQLGIYDLLKSTCGIETRCWDTYLDGVLFERRDFVSTTPHHTPLFSFYHPLMQEVLAQAAQEAGAVIWRGALASHVRPGRMPSVAIAKDGHSHELKARLIVGADGRESSVRKWAGFAVSRDPQTRLFAGAILADVQMAPVWHEAIRPDMGQSIFLAQVAAGRVRAYLAYPKACGYRLSGAAGIPGFLAECIRTSGAPEIYERARVIGPLASFDAEDSWVEHPYRNGIALIGDAAATSDPTLGEGLSLTLRDARVLRDFLLLESDWETAGGAYAQEHDRYYAIIHRLETWIRTLFLATGPEAERRRGHALPLIVQDPSRFPDLFGLGPEAKADETARGRFFGEA